jgi:hypothetical protein
MSIVALKARLADLAETVAPSSPGIPTGIVPLDRALPGGLPRGKVSVLVGPPGSGRTGVGRRIVETALAGQLDVAVVDAQRTLAALDWAHLGEHDGFRVVRPPKPEQAAWCADLLLRSGAFGLVVLDGGPTLDRTVAARLAGLAKQHDAALLVLADEGAAPPAAAVRLVVRREPRRWKRLVVIQVEKGGLRERVEVPHEVRRVRRLAMHGEGADRRGGAG